MLSEKAGFFKVRMSAPSELDGLMDAASYQSQIGA